MAELQRIVSVLPEGEMNHNVLRNAIDLLAAEIESRGIEHVTLDGDSDGFQRDLLRYAAEPGCGIYLGHRFYDLRLIHSKTEGFARCNLFEALDRPVFAVIQDHPFSVFSWSRIEQASRATHFLCPSPEFEEEARFINPALGHFHKAAAMRTEAPPVNSRIKPLKQRPLDVFMSCSFYTVRPGLAELRRRFSKYKSPMAKVIDEVYQTALPDRDASVMRLFLEVYREHFGETLSISSPMQRADTEKIEVLSCIDNRIRFDRRVKVLRSLAALYLPLKVSGTLGPIDREKIKEVQRNPRVEVIGRVDDARARELFLSAKFAINVMPTYLAFVTERVVNAMVMGCCVISDSNSHLAQTFEDGREILFLDDCSAEGLADYFDAESDKAQAIAERGRAKAREDFSAQHYADDLIGAMREAL